VTNQDAKPPKVNHEGGRSVWKVAADTARLVALSTSQVLRKLDNSTLSIHEDPASRGTPTARQNQNMPGGGRNPYESRPTHRPPARGSDMHRGASPTVATKPRSPAPARERASWWSRLFRRG
jgi:hypothetical protein